MTQTEAGIISGFLSGGVVGGTICSSHGVLATVGGSAAGLIVGTIAGWLYAMLLMLVTIVFLMFWRAIRKRADASPVESEFEAMTHVLKKGTFWSILGGTIAGLTSGWLDALIIMVIFTAAFAVMAVACCELKGHDCHAQANAIDPNDKKDA